MKRTTSDSYRKRLINVVDYMYHHIGDDLDVNTLAEVACMSPYHFHRIYREMAQETVNATVRRMRLQSAASDLIRTDLSIAGIAKRMNYASIEAFSRAFTKEFGESPSSYRNEQQSRGATWQPHIAMLPMTNQVNNSEQSNMNQYQVEIKELNKTPLLAKSHTGDYMQIGQAFEKVGQYAAAKGLMNQDTKFYGIYYDDPKTVNANDLKSAACITSDAEPDADMERKIIPAGKYATLLFKGSYAELEQPYNWFFGVWLPQSGHEAGDFPPFEEYVNDAKTTPPQELLTRIHILLA